jgi:hypothetical protein
LPIREHDGAWKGRGERDFRKILDIEERRAREI